MPGRSLQVSCFYPGQRKYDSQNLNLHCCEKTMEEFKLAAMSTHEDFLNRLKEAIKDGDAKQVRIAEYCDISEQAVARWKRTGQISKENLFALSEISGYRYLWIKDGSGEKRISSFNDNRNEYLQSENPRAFLPDGADRPGEMHALIDSIQKAHSNGLLTDQAISHLTSFIRALISRR